MGSTQDRPDVDRVASARRAHRPGGRLARAALRAVPLLVTSVVALTLVWLNRSPWWGWAITSTVLVAVALSWHLVSRRPALVRVAAWLVGTAVVCATAVLAYPSPETRVAGGTSPEPTDHVVTSEGPVQGVVNDARTVEIFAGIPYAQPPVDDLRWRAPEPPEPRQEVLTADRFSAVPVQGGSSFRTRALSQVVDVPLVGTLLNPYPVSEDSLTLNLWRSTAPESSRLPVLVYVPGGGFATGSGALPLYDGESFAARGDMIVVTINYRLGVLGFLAHPELAAESPHGAAGNYGILDQLAALEWVRDNIASFGGDPDRVTVAGQSAGGESVCLLGATPLADGLLDGIIAGGGACMGTVGDTAAGDQFDTRDVAEEAGARLSRELGGATIEEMRAMPAERVVEAAASLASHWRPSIDGHVVPALPADVYAAGQQLDVPILVGNNADEASLALAIPPDLDVDEYRASAHETYGELAPEYLDLYPGETPEQALESSVQAQTDQVMTRAMYRWAHLHTQSGDADAYLYFFSRTPPERGLERYGAYHGAEVAYAFDNLGVDSDADYTGEDLRLRDQMHEYWATFVRTGTTRAPGLPSWPTVQDTPELVMELDGRGSRMSPRPRAEAVDFWMRYPGPIP